MTPEGNAVSTVVGLSMLMLLENSFIGLGAETETVPGGISVFLQS